MFHILRKFRNFLKYHPALFRFYLYELEAKSGNKTEVIENITLSVLNGKSKPIKDHKVCGIQGHVAECQLL